MKVNTNVLRYAASAPFLRSLLENNTITLDNSTYETITACDVNGFISATLGLVPTESAVALVFGHAVHKALEDFYSGASPEAATAAAVAEAERENLDNFMDPRRNIFSLRELLAYYFMEHALGKDVLVPFRLADGTPLVEKSFCFTLGVINLPGLPPVTVNWSGRLDLGVTFNGGLWVADHKTTSVMGEKFADDKFRSSQMLGYSWAFYNTLASLGRESEFKGVLINAIAMRKNDFERKVFILPYSKWQIDDWQEETLLTIRNFLLRLFDIMETGMILPTRTSCVSKYGKCKHFSVCQLRPDPRSNVLLDPSYYKPQDWSPLKES